MARPVLFCICPRCGSPFELKGPRLKDWLKRQKNRSTPIDPYCSYQCSSVSNALRAVAAKKVKLTQQLKADD